ncbi:hypothetical protein TWF506_004517 [Arthrobotrys conoides]|uniref:RNase H type-1 domain-containing protein n=1 Tax=Arthrobotrys conoides TaxID=74498 RepID=A0AAN8RPE4_9PEZI
MSFIPEHETLLVYDSKGRAVCPHRLRRCDICCVDYTSIPGIPLDKRRRNKEDDERVFIRVGETARFIPQSDAQITHFSLRPAGQILQPSCMQENPFSPTTPDQLASHYCRNCELTWLEGQEGSEAARSHPSHHTFYHEYQGTSRSLLVYIDGACHDNGSPLAKGAIGVYFGPQSDHNISRLLDNNSITSQSVEAEAAIATMHYVRTVIVPKRKTFFQSVAQRTSLNAIRVAIRFRLIIATDSSYLVECICKHSKQWEYSEPEQVYRNQHGRVIANSQAFHRIFDERDKLSMVGIQVEWYHVPRRFNVQADGLANLALSQS